MTRTPAHRIEITAKNAYLSNMAYDSKNLGRASQAGLEKFVKVYNESFAPGGVNFVEDRPQVEIVEAVLIHQATDKVIAEYSRPLFVAI